jgi:hypothetical protein
LILELDEAFGGKFEMGYVNLEKMGLVGGY